MPTVPGPEVPRQIKQPAESKLYDFDFSPVMRDGDTVASIEVLTAVAIERLDGGALGDAGALTLGAALISSALVQIRISGGTDRVNYKVTLRGTSAGGDTIETEGVLRVIDY